MNELESVIEKIKEATKILDESNEMLQKAIVLQTMTLSLIQNNNKENKSKENVETNNC